MDIIADIEAACASHSTRTKRPGDSPVAHNIGSLILLDIVPLAPVASFAEKFDIPDSIATALGDWDDVVILQELFAATTRAFPLVPTPYGDSNFLGNPITFAWFFIVGR